MKISLKSAALLLLCAFTTTQAIAASAMEGRRTLSIVVDQKALVFEAPLGMCFLDVSKQVEGAMLEYLRDRAEGGSRSGQAMLAAFAPCDAVSNLSSGVDAADLDIRYNVGTIAWLNPMIGRETRMPLADYLDMRESALVAYADASPSRLPGLVPEREAHRTENGVAIAMAGALDHDGIKEKGVSVLATTAVRGMPFEFVMHFSGKGVISDDKLYALTDKFMAQQISLNE